MRAQLPIRTVSKETGLTTHTIRAWEKRHGVLDPDRTDSNRRLYTASDVEKLLMLKAAIEAGHSISQAAALSPKDLKAVARLSQRPPKPKQSRSPAVEQCVEGITTMNSRKLEETMFRASASLGAEAFVHEVVVPVLAFLDKGWNKGQVRVRQEHLASAVIRSVLDRVRASMPTEETARKLLVTTPSKQLHELGALMAAIIATSRGWQTVYLGANLPGAEIAQAANEAKVDAVALSLAYPGNDPDLLEELLELRRRLRVAIPIFVGGRLAQGYLKSMRGVKGISLEDLKSFPSALERIAA